MIEAYLVGSIDQSMERLRQLRQIIQGPYRREYDGLRQICLERLDAVQEAVRRLSEETVVDISLQTPRRVREFERIVELLESVENIGALALSRINQDDDFLNRLITDICREINYPLIPPVVSHTSQDYIHIFLDFNLLCLPLVESRFLLHLPDIYHELCHPFHREQNAELPTLETYHTAYKRSLFKTVRHFRDELVAVERLRKPAGLLYQLQLWQTCWVRYWMIEFFCDLFAVIIAGPAYAWSHFHLCVKRGGNPFMTPIVSYTTHPADDARMCAVLAMLSATGFEIEARQVKQAWNEYIGIMNYTPEPEYRQCYPDNLLSGIVSAAKQGIDGIGMSTAGQGELTPVVRLLNFAWREFWRKPNEYKTWETAQFELLQEER